MEVIDEVLAAHHSNKATILYTFYCSDCNVVLEKYVQLYHLGMGWGLHLKFGSESFNHAAWLVTWRLSPLLLQNQMS
jgi:hypothetical protein